MCRRVGEGCAVVPVEDFEVGGLAIALARFLLRSFQPSALEIDVPYPDRPSTIRAKTNCAMRRGRTNVKPISLDLKV